MPWGSNITQMAAPAAPYQGNSELFYKQGAGERKKEFDLKVANARAAVRAKYFAATVGPKLTELKAALQKAQTEMADLQSQKASQAQASHDQMASVFNGSMSKEPTPDTDWRGAPADETSTGSPFQMPLAQPVPVAPRSAFDQGGTQGTWDAGNTGDQAPAPTGGFMSDPSLTPQQRYLKALDEHNRTMQTAPLYNQRSN